MPPIFPSIYSTDQLSRRDQVLAHPSPVPIASGVYAWWFREIPAGADATGCLHVDGHTLLYVGISPKEPSANGSPPSKSTLRRRLRTHYAGNASGSTLRKTLGCLLSNQLGVALRRVGSGHRVTLTNPGERTLDTWMASNARVVWQVASQPWEVERRILQSGLPLPLNIRDNPNLAHTDFLQKVRCDAMLAAFKAEIVADNGGLRRLQLTIVTPS